MSTVLSSRVNGLDAQVLDHEVFNLFSKRLQDVLHSLADLRPSSLSSLSSLTSAEYDVITSFALWCSYCWCCFGTSPSSKGVFSTPGMYLQNQALMELNGSTIDGRSSHSLMQRLREKAYRSWHFITTTMMSKAKQDDDFHNKPNEEVVVCSPSRRTLVVYGLCSVMVPYLVNRLESHMVLDNWYASNVLWKRLLYHITQRLRVLWRWSTIVNTFAFVAHGTYVSLLHRMLRLVHVPLNANASRQLAFDLMNQQLALAVLSEFFNVILPLLPWNMMRHIGSACLRWFFALPSAEEVKCAHLASTGEESDEERMERLQRTCGCALCGRQPAVNCHVTQPCLHSYCYYCIAANWQVYRTLWRCAVCKKSITGFQLWNADL